MSGNFLNLSVPNPVKEWTFNKKFAPLADNAFRCLGAVAAASQSEIAKAFETSRKRLKLGAIKTKSTDLEWLGKFQRDDNSVREAFGRLNNPSLRLRERLFWFHQEITVEKVSSPDDLSREIKKILDGGGVFANHSAALLSLAVLYSFDSYFNQPALWFDNLRLWHRVAEDDGFWAYQAKLDLQGDFEPTIYPAEIEEFRSRLIETILDETSILIRKILLENRIQQALIAYDSIRQMLQTDSQIEYFETVALAEFEQKYADICEEEFEGKWLKPHSVRNRILPFLKALILLAGSGSRMTNRLLTVSAAHFFEFAKQYPRETPEQNGIYKDFLRAAWGLAPPDSYIFEEVAEYVQSEGISLSIPRADSAESHYRMVVEDLNSTAPSFVENIGQAPRQKQTYQEPESSPFEGLKSFGWVIAVLLFSISMCLRLGSSSYKKPPKSSPYSEVPYFAPNYNYSIPPPIKIEPTNSRQIKSRKKSEKQRKKSR